MSEAEIDSHTNVAVDLPSFGYMSHVSERLIVLFYAVHGKPSGSGVGAGWNGSTSLSALVTSCANVAVDSPSFGYMSHVSERLIVLLSFVFNLIPKQLGGCINRSFRERGIVMQSIC